MTDTEAKERETEAMTCVSYAPRDPARRAWPAPCICGLGGVVFFGGAIVVLESLGPTVKDEPWMRVQVALIALGPAWAGAIVLWAVLLSRRFHCRRVLWQCTVLAMCILLLWSLLTWGHLRARDEIQMTKILWKTKHGANVPNLGRDVPE